MCDFLLWAGFFENCRSSPHFLAIFIQFRMRTLILIKKLATFWAIFLTNSSGHPGGIHLSGARCAMNFRFVGGRKNCDRNKCAKAAF
jgi:hypothetical protein